MNLKHKKILILSTGDVNGAYEAMYKIACILKSMNHDVVLCVKNKTKTDDFIIEYNNTKTVSRIRRIFFHTIQSILYKVKLKQVLLIDSKYGFFSKDEKSENINADHLIKKIGFIPEFIFTGMTIDFLNSTDLLNIYNKTGAEVYNITVDMNHFTGGCHFSWGCEGYIYGCSDTCPAILNEDQKLLAKQNFDIKYKNAQKANFKVIAGSGLTLEQAEMSKIYKNQDIIYNVNSLIDTELLSPRNRKVAKQIFNFEKDKFYILSGAQNMNDLRKGFKYLLEALSILEATIRSEDLEKIVIVVVSNEVSNEFEKLKFKKHKINYIKDYRLLSLLYQATDLYVNSSIEDSGPMMVSEALACGTPVVGFDTGVITNMVIDDYNGYKIPMANSHKLAEGILKILKLNTEQYQMFSDNAVKQVKEYSSFEYAKEIFSKILN